MLRRKRDLRLMPAPAGRNRWLDWLRRPPDRAMHSSPFELSNTRQMSQQIAISDRRRKASRICAIVISAIVAVGWTGLAAPIGRPEERRLAADERGYSASDPKGSCRRPGFRWHRATDANQRRRQRGGRPRDRVSRKPRRSHQQGPAVGAASYKTTGDRTGRRRCRASQSKCLIRRAEARPR